MTVAGIVLAAGHSTRMGANKLLLPIEGEPLVRRAARAALEGGLDPVLVVLGHEAERVREALGGLPCVAVPNARHALGLNTSLDAGIAAVPEGAAAAVVLLGDMPLVTADMIRTLVARHRETGAALVASRYGAVVAPPALYGRAVFDALRGAEGDGRGREVLCRRASEVVWVDWPSAALADVDAPDDLERARFDAGEPR
ncbi:MAG TPA: nucleotidyltransferase family protein [Anaeromyxobacter sp.]|nr:nucleotidyltransferase family protein [Anaeromyxobacter sp.]